MSDFGEIEGVKVKKLTTHTDDRGNFMEILRSDEGLLSNFGQASISVTLPGVIKAFHWHKKQDDTFFCISGNAHVVLHDLRKESKTYKKTQVIYLGDNAEKKLLIIPHGVAHGYRVLGNTPLVMLYIVSELYDPKINDEQRIPFDDNEINFDWTTKNK